LEDSTREHEAQTVPEGWSALQLVIVEQTST
jgi:hypothetical protein